MSVNTTKEEEYDEKVAEALEELFEPAECDSCSCPLSDNEVLKDRKLGLVMCKDCAIQDAKYKIK